MHTSSSFCSLLDYCCLVHNYQNPYNEKRVLQITSNLKNKCFSLEPTPAWDAWRSDTCCQVVILSHPDIILKLF